MIERVRWVLAIWVLALSIRLVPFKDRDAIAGYLEALFKDASAYFERERISREK